MYWVNPEYFWFLLLFIPAYFVKRSTYKRTAKNYEQLGYIPKISKQSIWKQLCFIVAYILIIVALCRPQYGKESQSLEFQGIDIIIALDTSKSMLADDLTPTRFEAAKKAVTLLISQLHGDRVGLIAFAGSAFLICPLTSDYALFNQVLDETTTETIPKGGTDLLSVSKEVVNSFRGTESQSRLLILISDGEDQNDINSMNLQELHKSGIFVASVTAGSVKGGIIPLSNGEFLKDREGRIVHSRANPDNLKLFSSWNMKLDSSCTAVLKIYEQMRPLLQQRVVKSIHQKSIERFQYPLAVAIVLLIIELFLVEHKQE